MHDQHGRLKLGDEELQDFEQIVRRLRRVSIDSGGYRRQMIRNGCAPYNST